MPRRLLRWMTWEATCSLAYRLGTMKNGGAAGILYALTASAQ